MGHKEEYKPLPDDIYPKEIGPYPNPNNSDLNCTDCGCKEGEVHRDLCGIIWLLKAPRDQKHVSFRRHAFDFGYRMRWEREKRFLEIILKKED